MRWLAPLALLLTSLSVAPVAAQDQITVPSPILIINQDRLFAETGLGARSAGAVEDEAVALAEENRQIEEDLRTEELNLTEIRGTVPPEEFTALADAFDERVRRIRAEQDAKARLVAERQDQARQAFFVEIGGILSEIVRERGAVILLDRRDVFLAADRIDITDEAIERVNASFADPEDEAPEDQ